MRAASLGFARPSGLAFLLLGCAIELAFDAGLGFLPPRLAPVDAIGRFAIAALFARPGRQRTMLGTGIAGTRALDPQRRCKKEGSSHLALHFSTLNARLAERSSPGSSTNTPEPRMFRSYRLNPSFAFVT